MSNCPCNIIELVGSGGISVGGSAVVFNNTPQGGVTVSGNGFIDINDMYYPMVACYPLDEESSPYLDRSFNELDGTALTNAPTRVAGVACTAAQSFTLNDSLQGKLIELEPDTIAADQEYSMSCWIKLTGSQAERTIYARGSQYGGKPVFNLNYSYHRNIFVSVFYEDGREIMCWSDKRLLPNWNYHIAVNVGINKIELFINGVLDSEMELPSGEREILYNSCWFGGKDNSSFASMNLQEFRLFPETNPSWYWKAEFDNICDPDFYTLTEIESD